MVILLTMASIYFSVKSIRTPAEQMGDKVFFLMVSGFFLILSFLHRT